MKVERKYKGNVNGKQLTYYEVTDLEQGEPIFVLRGRDTLALQILMDYQQRIEAIPRRKKGKLIRLSSLIDDFVQYGATAQLRFPD